jgi:hypothetical protein
VEAGDELELPSAKGDVSLGRPHDDRDKHPLQADRARQRVHVIRVERTNVVGDVDLPERSGAVDRCSGGGHLALPLMWVARPVGGPIPSRPHARQGVPPWAAGRTENGASHRADAVETSLRAETLDLGQVHTRFVPKATQQLDELHRVLVHAPVAKQKILAWVLVVGQHRGVPRRPERQVCDCRRRTRMPLNVECSSIARSGCGITVWTLSTYGLAQAYVVSLRTRTPSSDSFTSILARSDTTADPSAAGGRRRLAPSANRLLAPELAPVAPHGLRQASQSRGVRSVDVLMQQRREHLLLGQVLELVAQLDDRPLEPAAE